MTVSEYIDALIKLDQDLLVVQFKDSEGTMEKATGPSTVRIYKRATDEYAFSRKKTGTITAVLL